MVNLLRENGLYGIDFPEAYGGSEAGTLALAIAVEELSKVDASCGLLLADHELGSLPILLAANAAQKQKYLPNLASGEHLAAFALTEPAAGSDVARLRCRAKKDGDFYVLNGTKNFITNGGVANILTVYAMIDADKPAHKNAGVFIVEKDTPGFSVGKKEKKMGIRWSNTVELIFEDCRVPAENLLGQEGEGFNIMMKTLNFSRSGVAAKRSASRREHLSTRLVTPRNAKLLAGPSSNTRHRVQAGGHGDAHRSGPPTPVPNMRHAAGAAQGHEPDVPGSHPHEFHGQVLLRGRGHVGEQRSGAGAGRLWVHYRISRGSA